MGASHNSFICENSELKEHLVELEQPGERTFLLGDSGYAQRSYLMTPVIGAEETMDSQTPELHFNNLHRTASNSVERTIGLWKGRFRCLLVHKVLHYDPDTVAKIVIACSVLHNIFNRAGLPALVVAGQDSATDLEVDGGVVANVAGGDDGDALRLGRHARRALKNTLWHAR